MLSTYVAGVAMSARLAPVAAPQVMTATIAVPAGLPTTADGVHDPVAGLPTTAGGVHDPVAGWTFIAWAARHEGVYVRAYDHATGDWTPSVWVDGSEPAPAPVPVPVPVPRSGSMSASVPVGGSVPV